MWYFMSFVLYLLFALLCGTFHAAVLARTYDSESQKEDILQNKCFKQVECHVYIDGRMKAADQ